MLSQQNNILQQNKNEMIITLFNYFIVIKGKMNIIIILNILVIIEIFLN